LCHAIKEEYSSLPDEELDDQDGQESRDDVELSIADLGINSNELESISYGKDDEDLDLERCQILQERMEEYN